MLGAKVATKQLWRIIKVSKAKVRYDLCAMTCVMQPAGLRTYPAHHQTYTSTYYRRRLANTSSFAMSGVSVLILGRAAMGPDAAVCNGSVVILVFPDDNG